MSDAPQGPGWWQASDGRWYPPQQAPGGAAPPPGYGPSPGYGAPPGYGGLDAVRPTKSPDVMAIVALVVGIAAFPLGCFCGIGWLGSPVAAVLGFLSHRNIKASGDRIGGDGLAIAGMVLGIIGTVLLLLWVLYIVFLGGSLLFTDYDTNSDL